LAPSVEKGFDGRVINVYTEPVKTGPYYISRIVYMIMMLLCE